MCRSGSPPAGRPAAAACRRLTAAARGGARRAPRRHPRRRRRGGRRHAAGLAGRRRSRAEPAGAAPPPVLTADARDARAGVGELPTPRAAGARGRPQRRRPTPDLPPSAPLLRAVAPRADAAGPGARGGAGDHGVGRGRRLPREQPAATAAPAACAGPRRRAPAARAAGVATRPIVPREGGLEIAAGCLHLWDLPAGDGAFVLTGSAAARATFLDRAGAPLTDIEAVPGDGLRLAVPAAANRLAVSCLGEPPEGLKVEPGPGAVALAAAAPRAPRRRRLAGRVAARPRGAGRPAVPRREPAPRRAAAHARRHPRAHPRDGGAGAARRRLRRRCPRQSTSCS